MSVLELCRARLCRLSLYKESKVAIVEGICDELNSAQDGKGKGILRVKRGEGESKRTKEQHSGEQRSSASYQSLRAIISRRRAHCRLVHGLGRLPLRIGEGRTEGGPESWGGESLTWIRDGAVIRRLGASWGEIWRGRHVGDRVEILPKAQGEAKGQSVGESEGENTEILQCFLKVALKVKSWR